MSRGRRGAAYERKSRDFFEALGYVVVRSAASKTPVDLVAVNDKETLLIQVKSGRKPWPCEVVELTTMPVPPEAAVIIHRWVKFQKYPETTVVRDTRTIPLSVVRGAE